jgi:hypothetical protein
MWNAGNTGDRRPQLRLTFRPGHLRLAAAAGMPDAVNNQDLDLDGQLDGLDAAVPAFQALAEVAIAHIVLGVWGHLGHERFATLTGEHTFANELVGGHLQIAPGARLSFQGEGFWGHNASDVRAGIGQTFDHARAGNGIRTIGGWAEATLTPCDRYDVSLGASIDHPHGADLASDALRENSSVYLAQHWKPFRQTTVGLDYIRWNTLYVGGVWSGRANRFNGFLVYAF